MEPKVILAIVGFIALAVLIVVLLCRKNKNADGSIDWEAVGKTILILLFWGVLIFVVLIEGGNDYYFVCDSNDAVLIEEKERENYTIPKKQKNWMGQANIFYAQKEEIYDEIINLLNKLKMRL